MLTVNWQGGMAFETIPPSGNRFVMDAISEFGGSDQGPTPVEALLGAVAACSAMDVVSILQKKKQKIDSYHIEVEWQRGPEGEWPRPILTMVVRHVLKGENLDPIAVARAVELSDTKYCTVIATLRSRPAVTSEYVIEE